ncbi:MAG: choice-of-anchor D domain-containing protein [Deltaproteobacteria bacterium]
MRSRWTASLGLFALAACGGGDDSVDPPSLFMEPGEIRFGVVEVGNTSKAVSTITNLNGDAFEIEDIEMRPLDQLTFEFSYTPSSVAAGEGSLLEVTYHPVGEGDSAIDLIVTPKGGDPVTMKVTGTAQPPATLRVSDLSIDFGMVPLGTTKDEVSSFTNREATSGTVTFDPGLNIDLCADNEFNTFCVEFSGVAISGTNTFPIGPNETISYVARFIPEVEDIQETASFTLSTCTGDEDCEVEIDLFGSGTM